MTHGEAKVNQKDVARFKELSDTVLKNADTRKGALHDHLSGKDLSPVVAGDLGKMPGSSAPEGTFVPPEAKKVVEKAQEEKAQSKAADDKPKDPTQTEAEAKKDAEVVAKVAEKHDKEVKENMKEVKAENVEKEKEKAAEDTKLKVELAKASGMKQQEAEKHVAEVEKE